MGIRLEVGGPELPVSLPVPPPWWITEMLVPAYNPLGEPHVHVDHRYVAIVDSPVPVREPVHRSAGTTLPLTDLG